MVLNIHNNACYLNKLKSRSQTEGHFFLLDDSNDLKDNGAVVNIVQITNRVMSSAVESVIGAIFFNSRKSNPSTTNCRRNGA